MDFLKNYNFCSAKKPGKSVGKQRDKKKIANRVSDKGLLPRIIKNSHKSKLKK